LNYLNNILARIEANRAGMDEALMLNLDGYVSEGSVDNIVIVSDGVLRTPRLGDDLLAGVTRAVIIDLARQAGIPCEETSLTLQDLAQAEECFLTGTGAELVPVKQIGERVLAAPDTDRLHRYTLAPIIGNHCQVAALATFSWLLPVRAIV
jgi:branched-chain amino acid aminotransferase